MNSSIDKKQNIETSQSSKTPESKVINSFSLYSLVNSAFDINKSLIDDNQPIEGAQELQIAEDVGSVAEPVQSAYNPVIENFKNVMALFDCDYKGDSFVKEKSKPEVTNFLKGRKIPKNEYNKAVLEYKILQQMLC